MFTLGKILWPRFSNRTTGFRHLTFDLSDHPLESCGPEHFLREIKPVNQKGISLTSPNFTFFLFHSQKMLIMRVNC